MTEVLIGLPGPWNIFKISVLDIITKLHGYKRFYLDRNECHALTSLSRYFDLM